jgi:hypothetical protein
MVLNGGFQNWLLLVPLLRTLQLCQYPAMASKKSPNFTELEKTVLIELVDSRKGIIESKQNDGEMISKRNNE